MNWQQTEEYNDDATDGERAKDVGHWVSFYSVYILSDDDWKNDCLAASCQTRVNFLLPSKCAVCRNGKKKVDEQDFSPLFRAFAYTTEFSSLSIDYRFLLAAYGILIQPSTDSSFFPPVWALPRAFVVSLFLFLFLVSLAPFYSRFLISLLFNPHFLVVLLRVREKKKTIAKAFFSGARGARFVHQAIARKARRTYHLVMMMVWLLVPLPLPLPMSVTEGTTGNSVKQIDCWSIYQFRRKSATLYHLSSWLVTMLFTRA